MTSTTTSTDRERVTLRECPPGPFLFEGRLGFKTEYGAMETVGPVNVPGDQVRWTVGNGIDVYVMASGEVFWGGAKSKEERDKLLVTPIDADDLALSVPSVGPEGWLIEHRNRLREGVKTAGGGRAFIWDTDGEAHAMSEFERIRGLDFVESATITPLFAHSPLFPVVGEPSAEAQARVEAIAALEPFAWVGQWLFARDLPDETPMVTVTGVGKDVHLTRGMFKAAHTAHALTAALSAPGEGALIDGWLPIESAPRDGTAILAGHAHSVFDVYWSASDGSDGQGAWVDGATDNYGDLTTYDPTHWMPLPAPPLTPSDGAA